MSKEKRVHFLYIDECTADDKVERCAKDHEDIIQFRRWRAPGKTHSACKYSQF